MKRKNKGKSFEKDFQKSIPGDVLYYRLRDSASNWGRNEELIRFAPSNMCDSIMFDGRILYLIELKNHKGKSLPLTCIRDNQLKELGLKEIYRNVIPCVIVNYEEYGCYCLKIGDILEFIRKGERKSIPIEYCKENGIEIEKRKIKVNYRYNVKKFIEDINKNRGEI